MVARACIGGPLRLAGAVLLATCTLACDAEICTPKRARLGFFSKGDCVFAEAEFFQGHEWITNLANQDQDEDSRYGNEDLQIIAEGNRRVDWPKELLIHMNNGPVPYINALTEYTDRPEIQRLHFLLTDKNDSREAARDSLEEIARLTDEAVEIMNLERDRGLTLIGRANHIIQDSFSRAHTVRDEESDWCLLKVKAYIERAKGFESPDIEYHGGGRGDEVGHTTVEDSIYREGRDCHSPQGAAEVDECLNDSARRARAATADYLSLTLRTSALFGVQSDITEELRNTQREMVAQFVTQHMSFCE
jgi:hypothetical protein